MDYVVSVLAYLRNQPGRIPTLDKFQVRSHEDKAMQHLFVWDWRKKRKINDLLDKLLDVVETGHRKKAKDIRHQLDVLIVEIFWIWRQLDRTFSRRN